MPSIDRTTAACFLVDTAMTEFGAYLFRLDQEAKQRELTLADPRLLHTVKPRKLAEQCKYWAGYRDALEEVMDAYFGDR